MGSINDSGQVLLSVVIICHNQRDVVKRCIDSVLQQKTTFRTEIIVSDDRSNDGTKEMILGEYKDAVIYTFCDSDMCKPSFTLERSGFNRLSGLKFVHGRYIIHTDGDDFFTSTDLFQSMVDTLEAHPECSLCCQNYCMLDSDNLDAPHLPQNDSPLLKANSIVTARDFFKNVNFLVNACFCARRACFNSKNLWGGTYDDNYITARYVSDGKIAILNRCDFVYVHYGHSSSASMSDEEKKLLFKPAIGTVEFAPAVAGAMLTKYTYSFYSVSRHAALRKPISKAISSYYNRFDSFILHNLSSTFNCIIWFRYILIWFLTYFMICTKYKPRLLVYLLYRLAVGKNSSSVVL